MAENYGWQTVPSKTTKKSSSNGSGKSKKKDDDAQTSIPKFSAPIGESIPQTEYYLHELGWLLCAKILC